MPAADALFLSQSISNRLLNAIDGAMGRRALYHSALCHILSVDPDAAHFCGGIGRLLFVGPFVDRSPWPIPMAAPLECGPFQSLRPLVGA